MHCHRNPIDVTEIEKRLTDEDEHVILDELYRLSRARDRSPLAPSIEDTIAKLIYSHNEEIVWKSMMLLGIIYPTRKAYHPILEYIVRTGIDEVPPDIASATIDTVAKLVDKGLISIEMGRQYAVALDRWRRDYNLRVELLINLLSGDISYREYTLRAIGALGYEKEGKPG